jgi:hypothetical protein
MKFTHLQKKSEQLLKMKSVTLQKQSVSFAHLQKNSAKFPT